MTKIRGFKIGKRFSRVTTWILRNTRTRPLYHRLPPEEPSCKIKSISKLINWGRRLKSLCYPKSGSGYVPLPMDRDKPVAVPKGHLAVYVGGKEDHDRHRVLVPVIYFNHPLFGQLLREAEEEYGFSHQGGITIPCRYADFEKVQTRIQAGSRATKLISIPTL